MTTLFKMLGWLLLLISVASCGDDSDHNIEEDTPEEVVEVADLNELNDDPLSTSLMEDVLYQSATISSEDAYVLSELIAKFEGGLSDVDKLRLAEALDFSTYDDATSFLDYLIDTQIELEKKYRLSEQDTAELNSIYSAFLEDFPISDLAITGRVQTNPDSILLCDNDICHVAYFRSMENQDCWLKWKAFFTNYVDIFIRYRRQVEQCDRRYGVTVDSLEDQRNNNSANVEAWQECYRIAEITRLSQMKTIIASFFCAIGEESCCDCKPQMIDFCTYALAHPIITG